MDRQVQISGVHFGVWGAGFGVEGLGFGCRARTRSWQPDSPWPQRHTLPAPPSPPPPQSSARCGILSYFNRSAFSRSDFTQSGGKAQGEEEGAGTFRIWVRILPRVPDFGF